MDGLELKVFVLGDFFTNSYVVFDKKTKKGFIVDVPSPSRNIREFIQKEKIDILFLLLTHAHFDHIMGLVDFPYSFYVHHEDIPLLKDSHLNFSKAIGSSFTVERQPFLYLKETPLYFDSYLIEVIHTPGHTPGSTCLKLGKWFFSGDTIFFDSIGRTDIPLASFDLLLASIKEKILTLPADTIIYPGHGCSTTVGREKQYNPFF